MTPAAERDQPWGKCCERLGAGPCPHTRRGHLHYSRKSQRDHEGFAGKFQRGGEARSTGTGASRGAGEIAAARTRGRGNERAQEGDKRCGKRQGVEGNWCPHKEVGTCGRQREEPSEQCSGRCRRDHEDEGLPQGHGPQ